MTKMAKRKIDKAAYDKLAAGLKEEYEEDGNGGYVLKLEDDEDEGFKKLKKEMADAQKKLKAAQEELDALKAEREEEETKGARKKGDVDEVEKRLQAKLQKQKDEYELKLEATRNRLIETEQRKITESLTKELFATSRAGVFVRDRIKVELGDDGEIETVVLDADGKATAKTLEDLKKEIRADKEMKPFLVSSKASGGAGLENGAPKGGGAAGEAETGKPYPKDFGKMTTEEHTARMKERFAGRQDSNRGA
jgi:chromosome segregation ATPase